MGQTNGISIRRAAHGQLTGQNKLAKDRHLRDLLLNPDPPDHVKLLPFDSNALRDAFTLQVGTLPDVSRV